MYKRGGEFGEYIGLTPVEFSSVPNLGSGLSGYQALGVLLCFCASADDEMKDVSKRPSLLGVCVSALEGSLIY
ncbi:hypothetical protein KQX54_019947 [Cotesia glomerata]|uniref:Uncharacterized protein n=1 Tax=Cotesia glomerata TaxID=32391 RepID=A0AAV7HVU3_COTGL|nr:hypothetical protein KQX54_019947 [Cotesia glomerata]